MEETDRRARLRALSAKAGRSIPEKDESDNAVSKLNNNEYEFNNNEYELNDNESEINENEQSKPKVTFRNYAPQTLDDEDEGSRKRSRPDDNVDQQVLTLDAALESAARQVKTDESLKALRGELVADTTVLAPRKVNWDLKKQLQPKLDRLERRTQRAIVQLLRERLEREAAKDSSANNDLD